MQVKFINSILLLLLWSAVVTTELLNNTHPGPEGFYLEGDMVLTEEQKNWLRNPMLTARNGLRDPIYRWPNGVLLYRISSAFPATAVKVIHEAMNSIASGSCIRFKVAPYNAVAYAHIYAGHDCSAPVGYWNMVQNLSLHKDCFDFAAVQHELLHLFGFHHQQNDPNRDSYVKINYQNIQRSGVGNFEKLAPHAANDFGVGYDFDSVMHYPPLAFSSNGKPTIESKIPGVQFGVATAMSKKDFLKLNRMYKCPFKNQ